MTRRSDTKLSGRFVLRIDPRLHAALRQAAADAGMSLNEYCAHKLAEPTGGASVWPAGHEVVRRAATVLDRELVGVVLFGSRARGEHRGGSDVDVLVVADRSVRLNRELYARWDERAIELDGHRVEPHFVQLPLAGASRPGLWAEVALDGVVLFSRDLELPSALAAIRRDIADRRIVRKTSHGQPYWVRVA
jgi:predicted nucleotidyltransferase